MARNEWINGYLEAILDAGANSSKGKTKEVGKERSDDNNIKKSMGKKFEEKLNLEKFEDKKSAEKLFSPATYFVEEVVNSFDESDLHKTWIKVIATRNTRARSNRLENMCWRIWHLARKKKQQNGELNERKDEMMLLKILQSRQITCPDVDSSYGEPIEMLSCPSEESGGCGAYLIRMPCGPPTK